MGQKSNETESLTLLARCQSASRLFSLQGNFLALLCCNVFKLCHSVLSFQAFLQRSVGNARQNFVACLFAASVVGFDATVGITQEWNSEST